MAGPRDFLEPVLIYSTVNQKPEDCILKTINFVTLASVRNSRTFLQSIIREGLNPIGPIVHKWAPRPILQTLVQVDWEPGPTEIVPNWAPHRLRPALSIIIRFPYVSSIRLF